MHYVIIGNSQQTAAEFSFGFSSFLDLSHNYDKRLRPKFDLRIFLDPVFVARSSSVLSWVLDQTWVLRLLS